MNLVSLILSGNHWKLILIEKLLVMSLNIACTRCTKGECLSRKIHEKPLPVDDSDMNIPVSYRKWLVLVGGFLHFKHLYYCLHLIRLPRCSPSTWAMMQSTAPVNTISVWGRIVFWVSSPTGMVMGPTKTDTIYTPLKFNMEPENHLFEKETQLPDLHFRVPC